MAARAKYASRALQEIHEGALDLFNAGAISADRLAEFESLCVSTPQYSSKAIKALRVRTGKTQEELAKHLNVSVSTLRQWELGVKKPSGPSLKLLNLLDRKGLRGII